MIISRNKETNIKLYDIKVYICAPCLGKTTLAKMDLKFVDMDKLKSMHKYGINEINHEKTKGLKNKPIINHDSVSYIHQKTEEFMHEDKILLFNSKEENIRYFTDENIPFCLVYFHPDRLYELKEKMIERGNNDTFISGFTDETQLEYYNIHRDDKRPSYKIELQSNEYLADIFYFFH